jgi:hypothetical protein
MALATTVVVAGLTLSGCGTSAPDRDKVFNSQSDAEQYALQHYCKEDSAKRQFGMTETIICGDGSKVKVVRVWGSNAEAAGYKIEAAS